MTDPVKQVVLNAAVAFERRHPYYREGIHVATDKEANLLRRALKQFGIEWTYGQNEVKTRTKKVMK